jgi:hypothetical protein
MSQILALEALYRAIPLEEPRTSEHEAVRRSGASGPNPSHGAIAMEPPYVIGGGGFDVRAGNKAADHVQAAGFDIGAVTDAELNEPAQP